MSSLWPKRAESVRNVHAINARAQAALDRQRQRFEDRRIVRAACLNTNWDWALSRETALAWIPDLGEMENPLSLLVSESAGALGVFPAEEFVDDELERGLRFLSAIPLSLCTPQAQPDSDQRQGEQ